ncbi:T9SS type A sorting domain-containing protein [Candidatus Kapabacteria bacterium]|nr:T9SS type A sorting domain-containing protein [Candidatus Kapabacteria bacterium]
MKIFILLFILTGLGFSQSFQLSSFDDKKSGDYFSTDDEWMFASLTSYADISNVSENTVTTNLIVEFIRNDGHSFAICDNENCYTDITEDWSSFEQSGKYMEWPAGLSDEEFIVSGLNFKMSALSSSPFLPQNQDKTAEELLNRGISILKVTLQNMNDQSDFVTFQVQFEVSLDGISSVEVQEIENGLTLSPNPAQESIQINYSGNKVHLLENSEIQIFDLSGNMISKEAYANSKTLDISNLPTGKYFQRITLANGDVATKPFIKE